MREIKGTKIPNLVFTPQKIGDLIYHEGPLLSLFIDKHNPDVHYLYKWADCDDESNRWLISPLNILNLRRFFYKEISLRTLLMSSPFIFTLELDENLTERAIMICKTSDLPEEYLPKENSFYNEEKYTEFSNTYKTIVGKSTIYDILDSTLKEVDILKKEVNETQQLFKMLIELQKRQRNPYQESMLYSKQTSNYEPQMLN